MQGHRNVKIVAVDKFRFYESQKPPVTVRPLTRVLSCRVSEDGLEHHVKTHVLRRSPRL